MKRFLFIFQILFLTIFISSGSRDIEATNVNSLSLPARAQDQTYYKQLAQNGNFYTQNHEWLRNGDNHIQVGISYFMVGAIGGGLRIVTPMVLVNETFSEGTLLAEILGFDGKTQLHAPCAGVVKGINPLIATPDKIISVQAWFFKCELKRNELATLMNDAEYTNFIK